MYSTMTCLTSSLRSADTVSAVYRRIAAIVILAVECLLGFLTGQLTYRTDGMITTSGLSWGHEAIEAATAPGTLLLAVLAIWGDRIKDMAGG